MRTRDASFKEILVTQAHNINLIEGEDASENKDLKELVCWMAMNKNTSRAKSLFDQNNESITRLEDLLAKYSIQKLMEVCRDKNIAKVYDFFIKNGIKNFLDKCPKDLKDVYKDYLMGIHHKFNSIS
mmetsp:Transcript_10623/g.10462  ORF Transcript_10623/g.10462 Transcript_10623/m.10462 type:complete len:127 (-) Transcript_10623:33-413(-)